MIAPIVKRISKIIAKLVMLLAVVMWWKQNSAHIMYHGCGLTGSQPSPIIQQLNRLRLDPAEPTW
jgi:hypothetical protein